jgi:hypothetical protein
MPTFDDIARHYQALQMRVYRAGGRRLSRREIREDLKREASFYGLDVTTVLFLIRLTWWAWSIWRNLSKQKVGGHG